MNVNCALGRYSRILITISIQEFLRGILLNMKRTRHGTIAVSIVTLIISSSPAVVLAQEATSTVATSTATSTSQSSSNSDRNALGIGLAIGAGLFGAGFLISSFASKAKRTSFGGGIISVIPCSGGMRHITIIPAGVFPISYIWTPFTITYSVGAPRCPGQH